MAKNKETEKKNDNKEQKEIKKSCTGKSVKCITHNLWDELEIYINSFFEKKKLSDLINKHQNRI